MLHIGFGAAPSKKDPRDKKDKELALAYPYPSKYDVDMAKVDVFYQSKIGVCTAAALCGIIEWLYWKKTGKMVKLSVAFLYIVTKLHIDGNFYEGSSLRSALKAALKYGVCTEERFPTNVNLSHSSFLLQTIPKEAWNEALQYKIGGYVSIPVDESMLAAAMFKYGPLYTRFEVSHKWYSPSWFEKDISPIVAGSPIDSGHAVALRTYDLAELGKPFWLRNSWSKDWFRGGDGLFHFRDYKPTEAWAVTLDSVADLPSQPTVLDTFGKKILDILRRAGVIW
jgi:hypothetical protein